MKKELRRYSLVEYLGKVERIVKTEIASEDVGKSVINKINLSCGGNT